VATLKYSRQRESIKTNLMQRKDHPTADMVYSDIRIEYPNISLGTVYRNLALLTELGEIQKISSIDGPDRYDGQAKPHNHFVCKKCGKIVDVMNTPMDSLMKSMSSDFEGLVEECNITFYGICKECAQKEGLI